MILIQFTGLSGSGKTTLSVNVANKLKEIGYKVEIIDGDIYRKEICKDLGFSKKDRLENIRRLFFVGKTLVKFDVIVLMAAINPYEELRDELRKFNFVRTVYLNCSIDTVIKRDTKGLYKRALLPDSDKNKIRNFTGISDIYQTPKNPDLIIQTEKDNIEDSARVLIDFILKQLNY